jgi:glycosyltransferase involved in cell wall biosynthesis
MCAVATKKMQEMAARFWSEPESTVLAADSPQMPRAVTLPVSVIIPVRNEGRNLARCLESVRGAGEVYVIDSQSSDDSAEIARTCGSRVIQFYYRGGWPKKRQWALDMLPLQYEWVLLLDADESLTPALADEIKTAIRNPDVDGYYIGLDMFFLGRRLRHCGASFYKLSLFRYGKGSFECRAQHQNASMCDMEVHEHVMVSGPTKKLGQRLVHRNVDTLSRYIQKHNEYSNWEAQVWRESGRDRVELQGKLFGSQAERRRWFRKKFFSVPGSSLLFMFYKYVLCLGFLDGIPGLIYCGLQGIQFFQIKAKVYEAKIAARESVPRRSRELTIVKDSNVRH